MNKKQAFNIYMNKKLVKKVNKENTPPEGWTEEAKDGARQAAAIGLSLDDLDDGGDMAAEFNEIMDLNSDLYK